MKQLLILLFFICIVSCSQRTYTYKFAMENPVQSDKLAYEDDTMSITYFFYDDYIKMELYNKSSEGIKLSWDEVSVSFNGKAHRVYHKETGLMTMHQAQPPTTIPPKSKMVDALVLSGFVKTQPSPQQPVKLLKMFPVRSNPGDKKFEQYIYSLKGVRVSVFLPYYIKNIFHSKTFDFVVKDVIRKNG